MTINTGFELEFMKRSAFEGIFINRTIINDLFFDSGFSMEIGRSVANDFLTIPIWNESVASFNIILIAMFGCIGLQIDFLDRRKFFVLRSGSRFRGFQASLIIFIID